MDFVGEEVSTTPKFKVTYVDASSKPKIVSCKSFTDEVKKSL